MDSIRFDSIRFDRLANLSQEFILLDWLPYELLPHSYRQSTSFNAYELLGHIIIIDFTCIRMYEYSNCRSTS